jgi:hypothetical protein
VTPTLDPFLAWDRRWQAQRGDTLPALELQDPEPITPTEAARLTRSEPPLTPAEWLAEARTLLWWAGSLFLAAVCAGVLLTWLRSGVGAGALWDAMKACAGG